MTDRRKTVVCIATAPNRWEIMAKYCFNDHFRRHRDQFDICLIMNGQDPQAIRNVQELSPEYVYERENLGMDQAAFDYALKHLPAYETYVLIHDDHWFVDADWFPKLHGMLHAGEFDVLGNLVAPAHLNKPVNYDAVADTLGFASFDLRAFPCFLQGQAGFYNRRAIDCVLRHGGVPWGRTNTREVASTCERLHSFIMLSNGIKLGQMPPGYELYMRHREHVADPNQRGLWAKIRRKLNAL